LKRLAIFPLASWSRTTRLVSSTSRAGWWSGWRRVGEGAGLDALLNKLVRLKADAPA